MFEIAPVAEFATATYISVSRNSSLHWLEWGMGGFPKIRRRGFHPAFLVCRVLIAPDAFSASHSFISD